MSRERELEQQIKELQDRRGDRAFSPSQYADDQKEINLGIELRQERGEAPPDTTPGWAKMDPEDSMWGIARQKPANGFAGFFFYKKIR